MSIEPSCDYCSAIDKFRCRSLEQAHECDSYDGPKPSPFDGLSGPYDIILADPPWKFTSNTKDRPGRNAMGHYDCMKLDDIAALPVRDLVGRDAMLFMWTTAPFAVLSQKVYEEWGFTYVSQLAWPKQRAGTGFWVRNQHEIVYVCKRGKFPCPKPAPFPTSLIPGAQRQHSRKPDWLHEQIDTVWPDARKLELFAREGRPGWTVWGNETGKFDAPDADLEDMLS